MGIRDDIQSELTEAFNDVDGLADVVSVFDIVKSVKGAYDPADDDYSETESVSASRGVFSSFSAMERAADPRIKYEHEKVVVNGVDMLVTPEINDVVRLYTDATKTTVLENKTIHEARPVMGGDTTPIVWILRVGGNA